MKFMLISRFFELAALEVLGPADVFTPAFSEDVTGDCILRTQVGAFRLYPHYIIGVPYTEVALG